MKSIPTPLQQGELQGVSMSPTAIGISLQQEREDRLGNPKTAIQCLIERIWLVEFAVQECQKWDITVNNPKLT
jgi:hypothetical protein